jgi:hypothetical protein
LSKSSDELESARTRIGWFCGEMKATAVRPKLSCEGILFQGKTKAVERLEWSRALTGPVVQPGVG